MFKKPKRHFRQRNAAEGSDNDEEEKGQEISGNSHANKTQKSDKKEKKEKSSIVKPVCFDLEDENEEEAFQIKKSSKSKKLVQRLKKENKRELTDDNSDSDGSKSVRKERKEKGMSVILNGDKAADMELDSDYELHPEDEDEKQPKHAFRTVLERGEIPDAHIIHLARKKRAQARERGDYIPLDDTQRVEAIPKSTSRLIRDDDNDASDDEEERVDFTLNTAERERQLIKDNFLAAEHGSDVESEHERDWEEQQIRKVVGPQHLGQADGTQTANYYDMAHSDYQSYDSNNYVNDFQDQLLKPLPDSISLDQIKKSLVERLSNLEQVHRVHQQEKENTQVGLAQCHKATEELDDKSENSPLAKLNAKYRFMQEVRSYLRNLIGCYNEKYPKVTELDNAVMALAKARSDKLCKRRQEDIKDEAADCSVSLNKAVIVAETPSEKRQQAVKQRRVADREARRTRRRQARLDMKLQEQHDDGLSSDDEESKSESLKYESDRETILKEASSLMDDVLEEFSSPHLLLDKFVAWKKTYGNTYNEAYVGLCLPKLLSPIIKLSLVSWNPIEDEPEKWTNLAWFRAVVTYSCRVNGFVPDDSDHDLLPLIVEKVLIPKLTGYVQMVWDPVSTRQTQRLSSLLHTLVEQYYTLNSSSKNTGTLLEAISKRISVSLDEDTFMPLYSKELLSKSSEAKAFLQRQIWSNIKLLRNILRFNGILSDSKLKLLALDSLLNRYIILGLQCSGADQCIKKIKNVVDSLPSNWRASSGNDKTIPQLENLCRYIKSCAAAFYDAFCNQSKSDIQKRDTRDKLKELMKILVSISALDHAKWLSNEYSISIDYKNK